MAFNYMKYSIRNVKKLLKFKFQKTNSIDVLLLVEGT